MRRPAISLVFPALLALLAAGCDSNPLQPEEVAGAYVLESVNAQPLPAAHFDNGVGTFYVLSDTLRLQEDGLGTQVRVHRADWADPARPDDVLRWEDRVGYRLHGDRVRMSYVCPPGMDCIPGPPLVGGVDGAELVLRDRTNVYRYRRLAP